MERVKKKIIVISLLAVILTIALVIIIGFSKIFYTPKQDGLLTYKLAVQSLIPTAGQSKEWADKTHFAGASHEFEILESGLFLDPNESYLMKGKMQYSFGKIKLKYTISPDKQYVFRQSDFYYNQVKPVENMELQENQGYMAYLAFQNDKTLGQVYEEYSFALKESQNSTNIQRFVIDTTNRSDDTALFMYGPGCYVFLNQREYAFSEDPVTTSSRFMAELFYLQQHQDIFNKYVSSGLFGDIPPINFDERISHIQAYGFNCLGLVVSADKVTLERLFEKKDVVIWRIDETK